MLKDLRHAVRMLLHAKAWTIVVVLSLALGIGANTAIFSAVNGLLLRKLAVPDPDTLVRLRWAGANQMATNSSEYGNSANNAAGQRVRATFSYAIYQQFVEHNQTMTDVFACAPFGRVSVVVNGQAEIATSLITTGNYYRLLGINAERGRIIVPEDDRENAPPVAVISHRYWRTRFGSDPNVVGKDVRINTVPVTIVGVLPAYFTGVQQPFGEPSDIAFPLALDPQLTLGEKRLAAPTTWWLQVMGRLKPGATPAQVQANLDGVLRTTARAGLDSYLAGLSESDRNLSRNQNRKDVPTLQVDLADRGIYDAGRTELTAATILSAVVGLVLLIVCANVANLLLSRAATRQKEISVRLSMGATRGRLIRQLLTESVLLAFIGGALGVVVGYWGKQLLPGGPGQATLLDWRVLSFVLAVTVVTGILFGIAPALRATRINVSSALKETGRTVTRSHTLLGKSLLVVQVAISLVLLIGAGLFLRSLQHLRNVDVGFNTQNLVLFRVNPQLNRYDDKRVAALYEQLLQRVQSIPGVRAVTVSQPALMTGSVNQSSFFIQGRSYAPGQLDSINRVVTGPNFFQTMEIPLLLGRDFTPRDVEGAPRVVIINDAAAKKYFPGQNPVGQRVGNSVEGSGQFEIVGVTRDTIYTDVREPAPPTMFAPHLQSRTVGPMIIVRTAGEPMSAIASIRTAVAAVDPTLPILNMFTQMEQVEERLAQERLFAQAYLLFGTLALVLAAIGLFGLMSYSVSRRTNEIGIRMAVGAHAGDVLRLVMRESMLLVVIGVVVGLGVAFAAGRLVRSLLHGVAATDALSIAVAVVVMGGVAALAGYLPARRAARVDPMTALRYE